MVVIGSTRRLWPVAIPVRIRAPQLRSVRSVREHVFAMAAALSEIHRARGEGCHREFDVVRGGAAPDGDVRQRWRHTLTLRKWPRDRGISTDHFDPYASPARSPARPRRSAARRGHWARTRRSTGGSLKKRLYDEGLKERRCVALRTRRGLARPEDGADPRPHQRGRTDNRLENLRIVCPNCAADARHALRPQRRMLDPRPDVRNVAEFRRLGPVGSGFARSIAASTTSGHTLRVPRPESRKVPRPTYEQLKQDLLTHELGRGRPKVRRQRQRRAEVDSLVQA